MNKILKILPVFMIAMLGWTFSASTAIFKYRDANGGAVFTDRELTEQESKQRGLTLYDSQVSSEPAVKSLPMPSSNSSYNSEADLAWLSSKLIEDYRGKIGKIEKLTSTTCWAILDPTMSVPEVKKNTGLICEYIRNSTGRKVEPNVHTFQGMTHMAVAKPPDCIPELKIEKW